MKYVLIIVIISIDKFEKIEVKNKLKILLMITFGIIIGIFSKYSDTSGKIISHYFGILSSGIFFWFFMQLWFYICQKQESYLIYITYHLWVQCLYHTIYIQSM